MRCAGWRARTLLFVSASLSVCPLLASTSSVLRINSVIKRYKPLLMLMDEHPHPLQTPTLFCRRTPALARPRLRSRAARKNKTAPHRTPHTTQHHNTKTTPQASRQDVPDELAQLDDYEVVPDDNPDAAAAPAASQDALTDDDGVPDDEEEGEDLLGDNMYK